MNTRNRIAPASPWVRETAVGPAPCVPVYRVGEPFLAGREAWPEGACYGYGPRGHELTIFMPSPSSEVLADVRRGDARFALSVVGPVFYLAYRFGASVGWRDVPYAWHLQHPESRATPPETSSPEARALLWVSLVGGDDGLVLVQRGLTLNPTFTRSLHRAILEQAGAPFDPLECTLAIAEATRDHPDPAGRLDLASAWSHGNA